MAGRALEMLRQTFYHGMLGDSIILLTITFSATSRIITLLVGEQEVPLFIHENILCESCPFFVSACRPEWMKDNEPTVKLPEDDPELINITLYCKYPENPISPKFPSLSLK